MSGESVATLRHELRRRQLPFDVESKFFRLGRQGYEQLLAMGQQGDGSELELANALHLLVWMRFHGDREVLVKAITSTMSHASELVRGAAVRSAIAIYRGVIGSKVDEHLLQHITSVAAAIRGAIGVGLAPDEGELAKHFLEREAKC